MKKNLLLASAILFTAGTLVFTGCSKDDTTPPVVTLNGDAADESSLNASYTDPGATATDDEDGTVTVSVSGSVDKDNAGTYTLTYSATDAAGNTGTATRTVTVANDAEYLAGTYTTSETGSTPWSQTITASTTINNRITFSKFANYTGNNAITAKIVGSQIELDPSTQNAVGIGGSGCTHQFVANGNGTPITTSGGITGFSIKFTDEQMAGGSGCTATSAVPYEDIFVKN